ncbi:MAG: ribosomal protein S18-alanine N-acetyltransferase [Candidatus Bathyarchaeota archaeon]|nr:ribosomal protein S18-alanine N-acetyltransferase [Candidatus Bathyarchaeota archaeon]
MAIKIEDATIRLLDKLYEIEKQCFTQEAFTKQHLAYLLTDYNTIGLVARVNDEIAGFILAQIDVERNLLFGHILTLNVEPTYRRKGIAQRLLAGIESMLREKGVKECRLEVREDNVAALNLYRKLGYKVVGKLEKYYGEAHGLYLRKILS